MSTTLRDANDAAWRRANEEEEYWQRHQNYFPRKYAGKYVAVKDGTVIAVSENLGALIDDLAALSLEPKDVWARYFYAEPTTLIL